MTERTPTDYALEFAEYMAKGAEQLIEAVNALALAEQARDEGDGDELDAKVDEARQDCTEFLTGLRNDIYQFRTRRDRAARAAPSLTVGDRAEPLTDEWIEGAFTDDEKRYACEFEPTESTVPFQAAVRVVRAAFIRGTLAQPAAQAEPVPGAVWGMYGEQSVCLIQRGTEDDRIAKAGGERLYRRGAAASNPPAQGVELPPLPEPRTLSRGDEDGPIQLGYTADQMHAYARAAIAALTAERDDLRAEVGAMRDDARRLDWLDAEISGDPGGRRIMCLPGGLRAAIDAASQKEQGGKGC